MMTTKQTKTKINIASVNNWVVLDKTILYLSSKSRPEWLFN